jgi:glycosyltransferase involved in cell wall biosynthesis
MKKKILIVITKGEVGGAQMSVLNLAKELKKRGEEVELAFGEGEFLKTELEKENINYHRFKYLRRTSNLVLNLLFTFEFKSFLKTKSFDVIHANSSNALFSLLGAKLRDKNIKTVFTFRGMSVLDENYQQSFFKKLIYFRYFKFFLRYIDYPVFVSRHNLELAKKIKLIEENKEKNKEKETGYLVYNGLDYDNLELLSKAEAREDLGINNNDFIIGSIGRLAYQKNYEFLIKVFPEILKIKPEARLIIIGEGEKRQELEDMIKELSTKDETIAEKIILKGNTENAYRYLKAFDMFILPSRYEGLSITLLEALKAEIPILASRVGGNSETLAQAELFELNNEKDFIYMFKSLLDNKESVIEKNLENCEKFALRNTVSGYLDLYYDGKE